MLRREPGEVGNDQAGDPGRAVRGPTIRPRGLRFKLSLRDLVEMMEERSLSLALCCANIAPPATYRLARMAE
jgi:hypothetical protein